MSILAATIRAIQNVQTIIPGYSKAMRALRADDADTMCIVLWPGRFTADFEGHGCGDGSERRPWMETNGGARGRFIAVIADPETAERERLCRSVAARVPLHVADVEDAADSPSDVVHTLRLLLIGRRVVGLRFTKRDALGAFHQRTERRRYLAAYDLERTHPAFQDRRDAWEALRMAQDAVRFAEADYLTACAA